MFIASEPFSPIRPDGVRARLHRPRPAPSIRSAIRLLIFSRQLITQDSPPASGSIFDVSLPPTLCSIFSV
jgi:hypothetical protein